MIRKGHPLPSAPFLHRGSELESLRFTIVRCLFGADKEVLFQAEIWGLSFMAVSGLNGREVCQPPANWSD
jgi:hypothetical protein